MDEVTIVILFSLSVLFNELMRKFVFNYKLCSNIEHGNNFIILGLTLSWNTNTQWRNPKKYEMFRLNVADKYISAVAKNFDLGFDS